MKHTLRQFCYGFSFSKFSFAAPVLVALALASPLVLQTSAQDDVVTSAPAPDAVPPSMQKAVTVMVEMNAAPAGVAYAAALKQAQAQADATRNYALAHPNAKTSKALLKQKAGPVQISSNAASQIKTTVKQLDQTQKTMLPALTGANIGGTVIFRVQRAYNGIAMIVSPTKIAAIAALPGVKAVHPMHPKFLTTAFSDIDFLNTRPVWTTGITGTHGEGVKVADIDTGLDYIHTNFGGSGSAADYASISDTSPVPNADFPTAKIPGGTDLAGDAYAATTNPSDPSNIPHPDPNPLDCNGHGTGTASLIAGLGVTNGGTTYVGAYDGTNPLISSLKIAPGFAPGALLYPIRVFGCSGSTNLVTQAIEYCMDPNGDGDFSDHMDVINMSLGSDEGDANDPDCVAASSAASVGIIVCSAAGNAGDSYYIHSAPAAAGGTLSCAASFNDQAGYIFNASLTANSPAPIAGSIYGAIYGSPSPSVPPAGLTGNIVYANPPDASAPLTNAADIAGNICMIDRGAVSFVSKVQAAQAAGAVACVVVQSAAGSGTPNPITMALDNSTSIPAVMIGLNEGNAIKAQLNPSRTGVNVTINNANGVTSPGGVAAAPDTMTTYSSRGPRLPDSAIKPDITSPAEVTGVAQSAAEQPVTAFSGNAVENFNGTSSATPHIAGMMALLKQLHPTWSVQELNALACSTANHDLFTTTAHTTQFGVGRVGAGRNDVGLAGAASVVAYNGSDANLIGVSFGSVEAPAGGSSTLTKNITLTNKGATPETYTPSIQNNPALTGATFTLPAGPILVGAGSSVSVPVTLTVTSSALKHAIESSTTPHVGQWLTEAGGYAVFTPGDASPTLRVTLYAAPKPVSSMTAAITNFVPTASTGSFNINLAGTPVNTGASLGSGFDILSLVKAFELQYASTDAGAPGASTDPNVIKYVGVTSDFPTHTPASAVRVVFGVEGFGNAATPDFSSSDKEIFIDTFTGNGPGGGPDGIPDFAVFLTSSGGANQFVPEVVNLHSGAASVAFLTNGLSAAVADTNIFNNSAITIPVQGTSIGLYGVGGTSPSLFQYQVVTFDRSGNEIDETPVLTYDVAHPGLEVENSGAVAGVSSVFSSTAAFRENFMYQDLPTNFIPVNYNGTNFQADGSLGVLLLHMHNGTGHHADVVAFRKPTVSGFSPASAKVGALITITGANFGAGTTVKFYNNQPAVVNVLTANTLVATVPPGAITGPIRVGNAAGSTTAPGNFTVLP